MFTITKYKPYSRLVLSTLLTLLIIVTCVTPAFASNFPNVSYSLLGPPDSQSYMGSYNPGTLLISSSYVSDVSRNMLSELSFICAVTPSWVFPGCSSVFFANMWIATIPSARYQVWLYDSSNGSLVWNGFLDSGAQIVLGNDHPGYNVYMAPESLSDFLLFVALVPEK